jgi:hypothetical protein
MRSSSATERQRNEEIGPMFGLGSGAAVRERANRLRILVALIASNLYTKTAAEFAEFYKLTTAVEQRGSEIYFGVKFSPSCRYDACATYPESQPEWMADLLGSEPHETPEASLSILGGGDDYGVFINVLGPDHGASVELHVAPGRVAGKDAKSMVTALLALPGFKRPLDLDR